MSLDALSWAFGQQVGSPTRKLVLLALADRASPSGVVYAGHKTLGDRAELGETAIRKALSSLEEDGFIRRSRRHRSNGSRSSDICVLAPLWEDRGRMADATPDDMPRDVTDEIVDGVVQLAKTAEPNRASRGLDDEGLTARDEEPNRASRGAIRTSQGNQSDLSLSRETARVRARVKCQGKPVPHLLVERAECLLDAYCTITNRRVRPYTGRGAPSSDLQQILNRVVDNPDVEVDDLVPRMRAYVDDPPKWVDGPMAVGHMFGPAAFSHLLAKEPKSEPKPNKMTETLLAVTRGEIG